MLLKNFKFQKYKKLSWVLKPSLIFLCLIYLIIFDRFFKFLAVNDFLGQPVEIAGDFFKLNFAGNYNIAFSLPLSGWWLNILIIIVIIALIYNLLYLLLKQRHNQANLLLIIIFGAVSNVFDRIKYGFVIDYFDLKYFTIFNLADVMIVGGVVGLGWLMVRSGEIDNKIKMQNE